jgi:hypothetical protein
MTSSFQNSTVVRHHNLRLLVAFVAGTSVGMVGLSLFRWPVINPGSAVVAPKAGHATRSTAPMTVSPSGGVEPNRSGLESQRSTSPIEFTDENTANGSGELKKSFRPQSRPSGRPIPTRGGT